MTAELHDAGDRHEWTLAGHRVTQLCVELASVRLHAWSLQASLDIRIATAMTVREADGIDRVLDPRAPEQLAPLLTLVGRELTALTVDRQGVLTLALSDGTSLRVESRTRPEAFEVQGGGALEGLEYRGGLRG
jgi:hypothetical protein